MILYNPPSDSPPPPSEVYTLSLTLIPFLIQFLTSFNIFFICWSKGKRSCEPNDFNSIRLQQHSFRCKKWGWGSTFFLEGGGSFCNLTPLSSGCGGAVGESADRPRDTHQPLLHGGGRAVAEHRQVELIFVYKNSHQNSMYTYNIYYICIYIYKSCEDQITSYEALIRAGEPANFLAALAPDFFFKRLRLLIFFPSGSGSWFFFERLRLQGSKNSRLRLLGEIFFFQTSKVKLQKKYKTSKIIVFLTIKLNMLPKEE